MKDKIRFLLLNEASYANTGFGIYGRHLLSNLKRDGRFTVAEFAFNGIVNHKDDAVSQWRFYAGKVLPDDNRFEVYSSARNNRYGEWRFEEILCDFKPHVVASICDPWMYSYIAKSPLRKYFKLLLMPTVDSLPYKNHWLSHVKLADGIVTYSNWAYEELDLLDENISLIDVASCGVDTETYRPLSDKRKSKELLGLKPESIIIGNVARNQPRKLFSDLFQTFRHILDMTDRNDIYLLCHTRIPDGGWDIPLLIKHYNIAHRVLIVYRCDHCSEIEVSVFKGESKQCKHCGKSCNITSSVSSEKLNKLYNCMDIYMQYASAGGFEIPIIEAAACGIQTFAVNVAAMKDFPDTIGTIPLEPFKLQMDHGVHANRASTDNWSNAKIVSDFIGNKINIEPDDRISSKVKIRYDWNKVCDKWACAINKLNVDFNAWNKPINIINEAKLGLNPNMSKFELFSIIYNDIGIKDPIIVLDLLGGKRANIISNAKKAINLNNQCESIRTGKEKLDLEDYIEYAHIKAEIYDE